MTFEQWVDTHEQQLHDGTLDYQDIWDAAQANYPYPICDNAMEQELLQDVQELHELSSEQAKDFVNKYGCTVLDDMWGEYSNSLHYYVSEYKQEN